MALINCPECKKQVSNLGIYYNLCKFANLFVTARLSSRYFIIIFVYNKRTHTHLLSC